MSTGSVQIGGKQLVSIKDAVSRVSYSRDYITRLAREKKITAANIDRRWFVDLESLQHYEEQAEMERELRKKQLRAERLREQEMTQRVVRTRKRTATRARTLRVRSIVATACIALVGLGGGVVAYDWLSGPAVVWVPAAVSKANIGQAEVLADAAADHVVSRDTSSASVADAVPEQATAWLEPSFATSTRSIAESVEHGVLLLPAQATSAAVAAYFSDTVMVREVDGVQEVVPVDAAGRAVGEAIPFVAVPVTTENYDG
jgi:hypothetical protein